MVMMTATNPSMDDLFFPVDLLFQSKAEIWLTLKEVAKELKSKKIRLLRGKVFELKLDRLYPQNINMWSGQTVDFGGQARVSEMLKMSQCPDLYQILVVPRHYDRKTKNWIWRIASPFFVSATDELIGRFMKYSNEPVDRRAKYAALYKFGRVFEFRWKQKIEKIREIKPREPVPEIVQ